MVASSRSVRGVNFAVVAMGRGLYKGMEKRKELRADGDLVCRGWIQTQKQEKN